MKDPNWKKCILFGDSKDVIRRIPDGTIDLILTDPPYNIGKHSTGNIPMSGRLPVNNDIAEWDMLDFNPEEWAEEFIRILKPTGNLFIFTTYHQLGKWYNCLDHRFDRSNFIVWHKTNPTPKIFKAGFLNSCELVFTCWNKQHTWNFSTQSEMHNFIESAVCMPPERLVHPHHPTQKPVSILKKLIQIASNENDIIFDPFMGVGSVGVAAMELNRKYIGVEIDHKYYTAAKERVESCLDGHEGFMASEPLASSYIYRQIDDSLPILLSPEKKPLHENRETLVEGSSSQLKPLLKWAGGKEKELKYILPNIPSHFQNYYEPFVGGGSVFVSVQANHYYINDLSSELIQLYQYVSKRNPYFIFFINQIDLSLDRAHDFFANQHSLIDIYKQYQKELITTEELKKIIMSFCVKERSGILQVLGDFFIMHTDVFEKELHLNLCRKMIRMRQLEREKTLLPIKDLQDNIETAILSALYMYFRHLYNDKQILHLYPEMYAALFFYVRNYCYSGMFRYNDKGEFNVPYGGMAYNKKRMNKKVEYYRSIELSKHLSRTDIYNLDFESFLQRHEPTENDFVFLDPPYDTEFSTYAQNEFTHADQERLADYLLNHCQAKWMLVIKNTDFIFNLYHQEGINIRSFDKKYLVSFMNRNRKEAKHLLITNYQ